ncbi:unnamed protein product [Schistosoma margrebowiei]|uniref:Uncharacterized protein n=1 Tax=Schistosoma margrebowiei TaxID=48269 RepID=A0A183LI71_9TREM|nr:unnamed protein product [Schistosoma margrebowiei]
MPLIHVMTVVSNNILAEVRGQNVGYIIDLTQSHDPAFIISGLGMVLAAFSVVPIIIQHFRRRRARRLRRLQQNCSEIVLEAQT